jgi:hypothetical protein
MLSPRTILAVLTLLIVPTTGHSPSAVRAASSPVEAPICDAGGPYACDLLHEITFDGRRSYDEDGAIASYSWTFGDGHTGEGSIVHHRYDDLGDYEVTLLVVDNSNQSSTCQTMAKLVKPCGDCPPICDASGPYNGVTGVPLTFDGSGSLTFLPCNPLVLYEWSFGDGTTGVGPNARAHLYGARGLYH